MKIKMDNHSNNIWMCYWCFGPTQQVDNIQQVQNTQHIINDPTKYYANDEKISRFNIFIRYALCVIQFLMFLAAKVFIHIIMNTKTTLSSFPAAVVGPFETMVVTLFLIIFIIIPNIRGCIYLKPMEFAKWYCISMVTLLVVMTGNYFIIPICEWFAALYISTYIVFGLFLYLSIQGIRRIVPYTVQCYGDCKRQTINQMNGYSAVV
jgi:hypothetical protein